MRVMRIIGAILFGLLAGGLVVAMIEAISTIVYPLPESIDMNDREALGDWIRSLPISAKLAVILGWLAGSFVGTAVARLVAPQRIARPAIIVLVLFLAAILGNLVTLPHPAWMWFLGPIAGLCGGFLGLMLFAPPLRVEQERIIDAPLPKVFETISTADGFSSAVPGIIKVEFLTAQKQGVGTRFRETRVMNGKEASSVMEIAEYEPNKLVRMVANEGGAVWDSVFSVTETSTGTRLRLVMDARPHKLIARLLTPLIVGMIAKAIGQDMDAVKSYCEDAKA